MADRPRATLREAFGAAGLPAPLDPFRPSSVASSVASFVPSSFPSSVRQSQHLASSEKPPATQRVVVFTAPLHPLPPGSSPAQRGRGTAEGGRLRQGYAGQTSANWPAEASAKAGGGARRIRSLLPRRYPPATVRFRLPHPQHPDPPSADFHHGLIFVFTATGPPIPPRDRSLTGRIPSRSPNALSPPASHQSRPPTPQRTRTIPQL
jgi:hypothetical protein